MSDTRSGAHLTSGGLAITRRNHPTYKDAGVDIDAGAALVERIAPLAKATARPGSGAALGGFGALFDLKEAGFRDPLLVSSTDGVGTKLKIAIESGRHETVGIDLVAMCVNDLVVQGAEPLFFLDYMATGKLEVETAASVVAGIARGCELAGCALVGGETAEMPGFYANADYDLAGFSVGAVERDAVLTGAGIQPGDQLIGLASNGLHSNGYSLVRKIVAQEGLSWADEAPFAAGKSLADCLLAPTRIYVRSCLAALASGGIKALAHITGGGLSENLPRVLPTDTSVVLDPKSWPLPQVMSWLAAAGGIPEREMRRTFNCGLGMIAIVEADAQEQVSQALRDAGEVVYQVGQVVARGDYDDRVAFRAREG